MGCDITPPTAYCTIEGLLWAVHQCIKVHLKHTFGFKSPKTYNRMSDFVVLTPPPRSLHPCLFVGWSTQKGLHKNYRMDSHET